MKTRSVRPTASRLVTYVALLGALCLFVPGTVGAQTRDEAADAAAPEGVLPDASFDAEFRKYLPPRNVFSPYYSWDAHMALNLTVVRRASGAIHISTMFQTVGTENLGARVGVGGTGYLLGLSYVHTHSEGVQLSSGLVHFSSHLTRDLDDKLDEERAKGAAIPLVDDPSEFNVIFFKGYWNLRGRPLAPELEVVVQPINFRFNGGTPDPVRPIYLGTRWRLWQDARKSLLAETQQEIGKQPFINISLLFGWSRTNRTGSGLQVFVSASPGGSVRVSPQIGALRNGVAFGIRLNSRA
jgi:hypothetical protein